MKHEAPAFTWGRAALCPRSSRLRCRPVFNPISPGAISGIPATVILYSERGAGWTAAEFVSFEDYGQLIVTRNGGAIASLLRDSESSLILIEPNTSGIRGIRKPDRRDLE